MKYVALDLETTGLDPKEDQILQISMVVEDTNNIKPLLELPHWTAYIQHERYSGNSYALAMNYWILDILSGRQTCDNDYPIIPMAYFEFDCGFRGPTANEFLTEHFGDERITVAGKNVAGFDLPFLPLNLRRRFRHRVLDPGTLFVDFKEDKCVPDLNNCLLRSGDPLGNVAHDAREDALAVIQALRTKY